MAQIRFADVTIAYGSAAVVGGLHLELPDGKITAFVGANGSGKSTILKAASRILRATRGAVYLDGGDIHRLPTREVAKRLAVLPQSPLAPEGITVRELAGYGRSPHQGRFQRQTAADRTLTEHAMGVTGLTPYADRLVDTLSGGERQRAWIAMAVAQAADTLVLDEPTTFLDLEHQFGVLELLTMLNRQEGRTVVLAVHDLNLAAHFADHVVVIQAGGVVCQGPPSEVLTPDLLRRIFHVQADVIVSQRTGKPTIIPFSVVRQPSQAGPASGR
jgi:iron complex transport system ATP-binding protein